MDMRLKQQKALLQALTVTGAFMVAEVIGGLLSKSLVLLADAGHMFTDVAALALSWCALWIAGRPATSSKTYGYHRAEILSVVINAVLLLLISFVILYEAYHRFANPTPVLSLPMLLFGVLGLGVNLVSMKLLTGVSESGLNAQSAYLEVLSDAISSIGVLIAGMVIWLTGGSRIDPLMSVGIAIFIIWRTWKLLGDAVHVLMEGVPKHLAVAEVGQAMTGIPGVQSIHDLHIWTISSGLDSLSAHVMVSPGINRDETLRSLQHLLKERFGIDHVTLQIVEAVPEGIRVVGSGSV
jgi:cobalt-zinc-cadmium efflux system protein